MIGSKAKFCSFDCYSKLRESKTEIRKCLKCGRRFKVYFCQINNGWGKGKFCSMKCYQQYPKSEDFKQKISKAFSGSNHPNWKGGIMRGRKERNLRIYREWRIKVFMKDNWTCQNCGIKNHLGLGKTIRLNAHHIKSWKLYPELRYAVDNGITLCEDCHDLLRRRKIS